MQIYSHQPHRPRSRPSLPTVSKSPSYLSSPLLERLPLGRKLPWATNFVSTEDLSLSHQTPNPIPNRDPNTTVPLCFSELCKNIQPRVSRASCKPIYQVLFPRNMGYDRVGRWFLDRYENKDKVVEGSLQCSIFTLLSSSSRASG